VTSSEGVEVNSLKFSGISKAVAIARAADVVVLALGIDKSQEGEGHDRPSGNIGLPGLQSEFAERVLALRKPTVLVLTNGGPLAIDALVATTRVDLMGAATTPGPAAIVEAFNPNTNGATALAKLLFGKENRFGKLPYTIYPASYAREQDAANFDMSKAPGRTYKYYQGKPLFPFGWGLSYSKMELSMGQVSQSSDNGHTVECTVRNTGALDGDEVIMVFHQAGEDVRSRIGTAHPVPAKALVGFERVRVPAGRSVGVLFKLGALALELVNATGGRQLYAGTHLLLFSRGHGPDGVINITVAA
jgi:beta-glucosidase